MLQHDIKMLQSCSNTCFNICQTLLRSTTLLLRWLLLIATISNCLVGISRSKVIWMVFGRLFKRVLRRFLALLEVSWKGRCSNFIAKNIGRRNLFKSFPFFVRIVPLSYFRSPAWVVLAHFGSHNGNRNSVIQNWVQNWMRFLMSLGPGSETIWDPKEKIRSKIRSIMWLEEFIRSRAEDGLCFAGSGIWKAGLPPGAGFRAVGGVGAVYK